MVKQNLESKQAYTYKPPTSSDLLGEFEANHRSYQSFKSKGLDKNQVGIDKDGKPISTVNEILDGYRGSQGGIFKQVRQFLSQVDTSKGPIERRVIKLERRIDLNPDTHKKEEHLVTHVNWVAKDYLGNEVIAYDIKEGMYNNPKVSTILVEGRAVPKYTNWEAVYDTPFSPEAVDDALEDNINPDVIYFVRSRTTRDDSLSLEQFRDTEWNEAINISKTGKGANR
jgi:hypothetical protein